MRNVNLRFALAVAAVLSPWWQAEGIPVPALDLPALTRGADVIVVGLVGSVHQEESIRIDFQGQSIPARRMLASLHVNRTVKALTSFREISFSFTLPETDLGYTRISPGQFGVFFLRRAPRGYSVVNPHYPFLTASRTAPATHRTGFQGVVIEIAQVLRGKDNTPEERIKAIAVLGGVKEMAATNALRHAVADPNVNVRFHALASLLQRNDTSVLGVAGDALLNTPQDVAPYPLAKLSLSLEAVRDPKAVPTLSRLLTGGNPQIRSSAANALGNIGGKSGIEALLKALTDDDRHVRYYAVLGLAKITGQDEWGPSLPLFEQREEHYVVHWKEWARSR